MTQRNEVTVIQLFKRHWRLMLATNVVLLLLAALITSVLPRRFHAEMKFLVKNERANMVLSPENNPVNAPPAEVSETQVNSEIELLKSNDILTAVVEDEKLYLPFLSHRDAQPTSRSRELATLQLNKDLIATSLRKTNVISVDYTGSDPDVSAAVLGDLRDRYLAAHLRAHSAPGTEEFFTQQLRQYGSDLASARGEIAEFHRQKHLFSMPQQQASVVERLEKVSSQLNDAEAAIGVESVRLHTAAKQMKDTPPRMTTQIKQASDHVALQQLEPMLAQLENRRIELGTKFKPSDRLIGELDAQIARTRQEIDAVRADRTDEKVTDVDPVYEGMRSDYVKSEIELGALQAQRAGLAQMRQGALSELSQMDQSYLVLQKLEQNAQEAQENYLLFRHRLDEVHLSDALDRDKFANIAVIESPVASTIPSSPRLSLNLAAALVLGLFLSLGMAFMAELRAKQGSKRTDPDSVRNHLFGNESMASASGD